MFRRTTQRARAAEAALAGRPEQAHSIASEFSTATCRFVLHCSCGATFDTNYIDEALEWHELHRELAPLADQLGAIA